ncbi:AAA family ATPase [Haliangium sp.]|uniref:AAA family ATPase n=1 Tax=Haliangium sp. TaxID=2663208 RepID=UPI003D118D7A
MFDTSVPATASAFCDRRNELASLNAFVASLEDGHPRWLAIIGPRKVGKTSLLLEMARRSPARGTHFVLLDSFEEMPLSLEFFRRYALRTLDALIGHELGTSLELAALHPSEFRAELQSSPGFAALPAPLRAELLDLPEHELNGPRIQRYLDLPEVLAQTLERHIVVAIDEFQELAGLGGPGGSRRTPDPLPLMRSVWQRHRRVAYVISGSARAMLTELVTSRHSPFFQHFALMDLGPFSEHDAYAMLTKQAPPERPIPPALARKAVAALGGHPFYLQMLGEQLTAHEPPYRDEHLKDAVQELLFSRSGRLGLYFQNQYHQLVGRSINLAATLAHLAKGPHRLTEIATAIGAASGAAARYLDRLGDAVVHRDDGRYELLDQAFALWLRWRQPGGTVVPMRLLGDEAEARVAEHLARMGFELVYQSRGSRGAFDLLATRGAAQLGVQVKRSALSVRLSKAAWSRMKADSKRFGWRWVVAALTPDGDVLVLDPGKAGHGREVRLGPAAVIDNLLQWLDR